MVAGLLVAVVVVAVLSFRHSPAPATAAASSGRSATLAFARSYVAFLDGRATANALRPALPGVRATAMRAGVIPPADRRGALKLRRLQFSGVRGAATARATIVAGDRRRTLQTTLSLTRAGGQWRVASLVPPDLSTVYAQPGPAPEVTAAMRQAATRFAAAYVAYRERRTTRLPSGRPLIRRQIAAGRDPLAAVRPPRARPARVSVRVLPMGAVAAVAATAGERTSRLRFSFILQRAGGRWSAWQFPVSAA